MSGFALLYPTYVTGNGYIQIYDWNGKTFETKFVDRA